MNFTRPTLIATACASVLAGNVATAFAASPAINTNLRLGNGSHLDYDTNSTVVHPGDTVNFRVYLGNTGTGSTGKNVQINDTLDNRFSYVANSSSERIKGTDNADHDIAIPDSYLKVQGQKYAWGFNDMNSGEENSLYLTFKARVSGAEQFQVGTTNIQNVATSSFDGVSQNTNIVTVSVNKDAQSAPSFSLRTDVNDKTKGTGRYYGHDQVGSVSLGDILTYRLTLTNTGSASAQNVSLKNILPAGQAYTGNAKLYMDSQVGVAIDASNGYTIPTLINGTDHAATITFEATVTSACSNATVADQGQAFYAGAMVSSDNASLIYSCTNGLIITKQVFDPKDNTFKNSLDNVAAGTVLTYRIEVLNNSTSTVANPTVRDVLSGLESYDRGTLTIDGEHQVNAVQDAFFATQGMILTNLTPGLGKQIEFQVTLAGCQPSVTNVKNTALAHGDNVSEITASADVNLVACVTPVATPTPVVPVTPAPVKPVVPVTTLPVTGPEMALIVPGALSSLAVLAGRRLAAKKALSAAIRKINVL